ncbi:MAG: hypothetical protein Q4E67_00770 [Planctomycetia bacterium]|nr:hypothetical protein [Planctomycetia bacterium]
MIRYFSPPDEPDRTLYQSPIIRSLAALLVLAEHPGDSLAHYAVAHSPWLLMYPQLKWYPYWEEPENQRRERLQSVLEEIRAQISVQGMGGYLAEAIFFLRGKISSTELAFLIQLSLWAVEEDMPWRDSLGAFVGWIQECKIPVRNTTFPVQPPLHPLTLPARSFRNLHRRAPSNNDEKGVVNLYRKLCFRRSSTLNGNIFHQWYEKIDWNENSIPSDEELIAVARPYGFSEAVLNYLLLEFRASLKKPKVTAVLSWKQYLPMLKQKVVEAGILEAGQIPDSIPTTEASWKSLHWEVHREKELAVRNENEILLGTLDRLVLLRNAEKVYWADCIDYKTTRKINPAHLENLIAKHVPQIQDYIQMLSRHYQMPSRQISARLVFSMLGIVREVSLPQWTDPQEVNGSILESSVGNPGA